MGPKAGPAPKGFGVAREHAAGDAGDGYRFGVAHHPERQIEDVHADIDARAAAGMLRRQEGETGGDARAAQHPTASVIDFAEGAAVDFGFQRLGGIGEAEVLRGHQHFAALVAGGDHTLDIGRRGRQGLLADDMLARFQGGDAEIGMIHVGRADIDDIDIGIVDDGGAIGFEALDIPLLAPALQSRRHDISAGDDFGMGRSRPAGHMRPRDAANTDHTHFQSTHTL